VRKAVWIGGVVVVVAAIAYAASRPPRDDYEPLRRYIVEDETSYYSATDLAKHYESLGGTWPTPSLRNTSYRSIKLESVPPRDLLKIVDAVARSQHLSLSGRMFPRTTLSYTPSGNLPGVVGDEPQLEILGMPDDPKIFFDREKLSLFKWRDRNETIDAEIIDTRHISIWDQIRVRASHAGRMPYVDPAEG
jgi:hypothetical protein